jgi:hypothetical protein
MKYGWVVLVLKLPSRELVNGTLSEIKPFSGTINRVAPRAVAAAIPNPKNRIDRARVVDSVLSEIREGGAIQNFKNGVRSSS